MTETMPAAVPAVVTEHRNEVLLVGRLAAEAAARDLPSGDVLVTWRLVIDRGPSAAAGPGRKVTQDTVDCAAWTAKVRRTAATWRAGDIVEVSGAMRRRFWRAGASAASRVEIEVARARRLRKAQR
jgi:single-strand DNA-binding protein